MGYKPTPNVESSFLVYHSIISRQAPFLDSPDLFFLNQVFSGPARHVPSATTSILVLQPRDRAASMPPAFSQGTRFLHWLTSRISRFRQPSMTLSTPWPVTLTQPLTERYFNSSRCRPMQRRLESETADPQKARSRWVSCVRPSERTSVAVSESAQQKD